MSNLHLFDCSIDLGHALAKRNFGLQTISLPANKYRLPTRLMSAAVHQTRLARTMIVVIRFS